MASSPLVDTDNIESDKMPGGSGKIQRSVSCMMKQMEITDEEIKYRMENFDEADIGKQYLKYLKCTKCNLNFQNIINKGKLVSSHPLLGVLLCDSCCDYYGDGNFSLDSEGEDKYCRWCGQGGTIFACSKCICGFCDECIKKHFGKQVLEEVKNDDDWVCYFCNPRPLWYLRSICALAKEAAKNKKEHFKSVREGRSSKKKKIGNDGNSCSSDTCTSTTDSIKRKQVKKKRFSKHKEKLIKASSTSSDDEVKNIGNLKSKRKSRSRSEKSVPGEQSSGSEGKTPSKKAKMTNDNTSNNSDIEIKRPPLLEKLKSIWKLTQTATEVGLKSSRERLTNLAKAENYQTAESLKKEHEELKSCISVLMSTLSVASNSAASIGEDLTIETAKDEREIFQSQETEIKRFAKKLQEDSNVETSFDSDRGMPSKPDLVKSRREEKDPARGKRRSLKGTRKAQTKNGPSSDGEHREGENGTASGLVDDSAGDREDQDKAPAKPLLKVKSFARMLDENVYAKNCDNKSVNGNCVTEAPIVIDLYNIDTDESECETQQKKGSPQEKSEKKSSSKKKTIPEKRIKKKKDEGKVSSDVETEENVNVEEKNAEKMDEPPAGNNEVNADEKDKPAENEEKKNLSDEESEKEKKEKGSVKNGSRRAHEKLSGDESEKKKQSGSEEETVGSESKNDSSEEETEKIDKDSSNDGKKNAQVISRKKSEKEDQKEEDRNNKTGSSSSSSSDDDDAGDASLNRKNLRSTRNKKKKKTKLKASFEIYKQKRENFLKSAKDNSQQDGEKRKANATEILESSESEGEKKEPKGGRQKKKRVLASSDEENREGAGSSVSSEEKESEKESEKENLKSDSDAKLPTSGETSSDEMTLKKPKRKKTRKKESSDSSGKETKKRRRKKRKGGSSESSDGEEDYSKKQNKGRKNIKKILKKDSLQVETKEALKNEEERKKRLKERQKLFQDAFPQEQDGELPKRLILDFDPETKEPLVSVHKKLVKKLKPHQMKGVRFMWDNCFESVQRMEEDSGSGCILAHCMGLGKTLQVITLVHTVMTHDLGVHTVLVVCPLSTVANWVREFESWLASIHTDPITLYDLVKYRKAEERRFYLEDWQKSGGVLIISYDLFRNLTKGLMKKTKKMTKNLKTFESSLLDPGPDLVVCDEGHLLKNEDTALSKCMTRVKTARRIVLTGTPLQNNLIEYHCMVQFVKPNILGTKKEFMNRFVNPINNGQFEDSTELDVKIMKRRSHVLHSMLDGCIQRFDYSVLTPFLPEKHEYVLSIALTETQANVYKHFISNLSAKSSGSSRTASLFNDYHNLQRIWTHPRTMLMQSEKISLKEIDSEGSLKDFIVSSDEESTTSRSVSPDSSSPEAPSRRRITRSTANDPEVKEAIERDEKLLCRKWWDEFYEEKAYEDLRESNKLVILFSLLRHCRAVKDKVLVFSQSLYSLDLIEYFLTKIDANQDKGKEETWGYRDSWVLGSDYFRLDGTTTSDKRAAWCSYFNKESNTRSRLFLLSTKAGGLGINLYGANRVVIFDASWNPSHDLQSIFRVYRFGQKKTCYVYRFLSEATMEEKIYERQVTKLSLAHRVVDEHQIERHYTMGNLQELYTFEPTPKEERKVPKLPKDPVLADILAAHKDLIVGYHEHDSLLENKQEEELTEEERRAAWKEYEEEKAQKTYNLDPAAQQQLFLLMQQARLAQGAAGTGADLGHGYVAPGQGVINPMFVQANSNIPLALHQRGLKVGLTPVPNESLDSYFMRILSRENWLMAGGQQ